MARDSGTFDFDPPAEAPVDDMPKDEPVTIEDLALAQGHPFGEGLKAAREAMGLSLDDVCDETKVRRHYLNALEQNTLDQLPSRPFAEGYVRAYARVLKIDEARAVARFRQDLPKPDDGLPEPIGVSDEKDPRLGVIITAAALVLAAIVIWNIAKRTMADRDDRPAPAFAAAPVSAPAPDGPVVLGDALPPPVEASLPAPYVTPGLEEIDPNAPDAAEAALTQPEIPRPFQAHGQVYGAPADQSAITLQAIRTVLVVIKGAGDKIVFAQPLNAGEAYRVPYGAGLIIDVAAPRSIEVFVDGMSRGVLTQPLTPTAALGGAAPRVTAPPAAVGATAPVQSKVVAPAAPSAAKAPVGPPATALTAAQPKAAVPAPPKAPPPAPKAVAPPPPPPAPNPDAGDIPL